MLGNNYVFFVAKLVIFEEENIRSFPSIQKIIGKLKLIFILENHLNISYCCTSLISIITISNVGFQDHCRRVLEGTKAKRTSVISSTITNHTT